MFKKLLIANRGEIACRVIRTCRRLGIRTVAVFSDADRDALHVELADEAVHIGPAPAAESYLDSAAIIAAARSSGAQAIHPGYGFLSENADFTRQVTDAGLVFIGPRPETMELMGSKARAKTTLAEAGVPLVPGYHGDEQDDERLAVEAKQIGYPLMLKAAAGGGGKGMRIVRDATGFTEALNAARREAKSAFGDERMILERYLERPRHIEVQVFGDTHGSVVHLFERDCSSQRRHQKVIEEAPAPDLPDALRARLFEAAIAAARKVEYVGAGTVEFLVSGEDCYFLEMNTRLQVEHPITEAITGLDLVEWQLRVAAGETLPLTQEEVHARGHAMEARVYAEDPERNFMPSSGRIAALALSGARVDSGVRAGDTVSVYYDPMIAKIIVHAGDRAQCLAAMQQALARSFVAGPACNLGFLQQLCAHPAMVEGRFDTGLLDRDLESFLPRGEAPAEVLAAATAACLAAQEDEIREQAEAAGASGNPWFTCDGWRPGDPAARSLMFHSGEEVMTVDAIGLSASFRFSVGGASGPDGRASTNRGQRPLPQATRTIQAHLQNPPQITIELDGHAHHLYLHTSGDRYDICDERQRWTLIRHHRFETVGEKSTATGRVLAPMPGKLIELRVAKDDEVEEGQTVAVMEAMKMELAIKAPRAGRVSEVNAATGDVVEADTLLLKISE